MDAKKLAEKARSSLGRYCSEECHAYCCQKGYLNLTEDELELVLSKKKERFLSSELISKTGDKKFSLYMGEKNLPCPSLKDYKCVIHKNDKRPLACKEFPLFIWENKVIHISARCPAVREGKLYPYLVKFKLLGYKIDDGPDLVLD